MEGIAIVLFVLAVWAVFKVSMGFGSLIDRASARGGLARVADFSPAISEFFGKGQALALDTARQKLAICSGGRVSGVFDFADVVAVEVCRNGHTMTRTNRGSQIVGAVVGAALAGPLGLVVGAVTGSKRSEEKITKLSLKIYTNDLHKPVREIVFYEGAAVEPETLRSQVAKMEQWYGRFRTIVESRTAPMRAPAMLPEPRRAFGRRSAQA